MKIPFIPSDGQCRICGLPVEESAGEFICQTCLKRNPFFERASSAVSFEGYARDLILKFKSCEAVWLKEDFVDWLEAAARARFHLEQVDLILPMPVTFYHRIDRGYNQSSYLAHSFAKRISRKCLDGVLVRCGRPKRQAGLGEEERWLNVENTFKVKCPEAVRGRTVLVVDDVMTTSATLSECAKELKKAGAWRVWCATVAHSL